MAIVVAVSDGPTENYFITLTVKVCVSLFIQDTKNPGWITLVYVLCSQDTKNTLGMFS